MAKVRAALAREARVLAIMLAMAGAYVAGGMNQDCFTRFLDMLHIGGQAR